MTREFDRVRASFASSLAGRFATGFARVLASAWATSFFATTMRRVADDCRRSPPTVIRISTIAIAVAAAMQPLLIELMPATVRPAMPRLWFIGVAIIAAVAAWRPDSIAGAWPSSRLRRFVRR
jgi:hypothetical protein